MTLAQGADARVRDIQLRLVERGYSLTPDGKLGPVTLDAMLKALGGPVPRASTALAEPASFFGSIRKSLFTTGLTPSQVEGINAKLNVFGAASWPIAFASYAMATSYWETTVRGHPGMQPVEEVGKGRGRRYGVPGRNGKQVPYGRGDVQLTWDDNYDRADDELGLGGALKADYRLALRPDISARIMVRGMAEGWFTGRKLQHCLPLAGLATFDQFKDARAIINGTDKDDEIAAIAVAFQHAFLGGGWG